MLSIDIGARHPKYDTAKADVSISKALFNYTKIAKSGDKTVDANYTGQAIHFTTSETIVTAFNLHITNSANVILDKGDVNGGETIYASYDLTVVPKPGYTYSDKSVVTWYISLGKDAALTPDTQENSLTPENMDKYYWQIVTSDDKIVTGKEFKTGDTLYVKDKDGSTKEWGKYGYVRFVLEPAITGQDGEIIKGESKEKSEWVMLKTPGIKSSLWRDPLGEWNKNLGISDVTNISDKIDPNTGKHILQFTGTSTGKAGIATIMNIEITPDYLAEQKLLAKEDDGKSYTTLANYSVIFDFDIGNTDGFGLLLSGYRDSTQKVGDSGLILQLMAKSDTMPLRIYRNGQQSSEPTINSWGIGDNGKAPNKAIAYTSETETHKFTGHGVTSNNNKYFGPFYGPGYMKNSVFQYLSDYYTTDNNKSNWFVGNAIVPRAPYNQRRRVLITVLEYCINSDTANPLFIIRAKYLKLESEGTLPSDSKLGTDLLKIGPGWFNSEPVWYGDFVGEKPVEAIKDTYRFTVKNYSSYHNGKTFDVPYNQLNLNTANNNAKKGEFYVTRVTKKAADSNESVVNTVFEAMKINLCSELKTTEYPPSTGQKSLIISKFADPKRPRYVGLTTWNNEKNKVFDATVYEFELAPGFSSAELKAIIPKLGTMYDITNINDSAPSGVSQSNLNSIFGSSGKSDGEGNKSGFTDGVVGIQHVMGKCTCPMCKRFLK